MHPEITDALATLVIIAGPLLALELVDWIRARH